MFTPCQRDDLSVSVMAETCRPYLCLFHTPIHMLFGNWGVLKMKSNPSIQKKKPPPPNTHTDRVDPLSGATLVIPPSWTTLFWGVMKSVTSPALHSHVTTTHAFSFKHTHTHRLQPGAVTNHKEPAFSCFMWKCVEGCCTIYAGDIPPLWYYLFVQMCVFV